MATPARRNILSNLVTTLQGITTGNGYKTTVTTVEALGKSWGEVKSGERPWIGVIPQRENFEHQPFGQIKIRLTVVLIAHVSGITQSNRSDKLNDLLDDVIAVLNVETTRDNNAIATTVMSAETDEGSPDASGDGSMVVTVEIAYIRTTSAS